MFDYSKELRNQLGEIERLLVQIKAREKEMKSLPEGKIRITSSHGTRQYHFREAVSKKEIYMSVKEKDLVKKMIQREYDHKVEKQLQRMKKELIHFLGAYNPRSVEETYEELCEAKKSLTTPVEMTDTMFIEEWNETNPGGKNVYPEIGIYDTDRGEKVRSKSEKIIADTLYRMNIPYQYEPQLKLAGNKIVYPDFACLNVGKRKTIYWEHLGLVQSNEYAAKNYLKLEYYEKNDILMGENLIVTSESADFPLDVSLIRRKIDLFLK